MHIGTFREEDFGLDDLLPVGADVFLRWLERGAGHEEVEDGGFAIAARGCAYLVEKTDESEQPVSDGCGNQPVSDSSWHCFRGLAAATFDSAPLRKAQHLEMAVVAIVLHAEEMLDIA